MYVCDFSYVFLMYVFILIAYQAWGDFGRGKCEMIYCEWEQTCSVYSNVPAALWVCQNTKAPVCRHTGTYS